MYVQQQSLNICDTAIAGYHHNSNNKIKMYKYQIYKNILIVYWVYWLVIVIQKDAYRGQLWKRQKKVKRTLFYAEIVNIIFVLTFLKCSKIHFCSLKHKFLL